jgi:excisionase family DNA binding protein
VTATHDHRPPLDVDEAAAYLGVTRRWVRRAIAERRIPYIKLGQYVRLDPRDLDAYLEHRRVPASGRTG